MTGCWMLHVICFSCRQAGPFPEVVNHLLQRRLIGYYLCCQKPSHASTSPHQSLPAHVLPVDGAMEHEAACCRYRCCHETRAVPAQLHQPSALLIPFVKAGVHLRNWPFCHVETPILPRLLGLMVRQYFSIYKHKKRQ